eukprot:jgi/Chrpa1/1376/Chrysochromulina_OHIO_Genome00013611-RA
MRRNAWRIDVYCIAPASGPLPERRACVASRVRITHRGLVITSVTSPAPAAADICTSGDEAGSPLSSAMRSLL